MPPSGHRDATIIDPIGIRAHVSVSSIGSRIGLHSDLITDPARAKTEPWGKTKSPTGLAGLLLAERGARLVQIVVLTLDHPHLLNGHGTLADGGASLTLASS